MSGNKYQFVLHEVEALDELQNADAHQVTIPLISTDGSMIRTEIYLF